MEKTRYPTLWIEDDYLWSTPFSLREIVDRDVDYVSFIQNNRRPRIGTAPSFWSRRAIDWLLEHYPLPEDRQGMSEVTIKRLFYQSGLITTTMRDFCPTDLGNEVYERLNVLRCWPFRHGSWPLPNRKGK
jgi:hypothetical protein